MNMHARATQTHSCCFCFDRCLCARHTVTLPHSCHPQSRERGVILFPSSPCLPNQSIAIVFTLHSIWSALSSFFRLRNANLPHSWTLFAVQTTEDSLTLANSLGISNQPNDLLPRIHRVSAVSGDDDDDFARSFSLSRCVFPPVLLTLDHWMKIDSTLLVLFSCSTFPLFYTFCSCFSTTPHTQLTSLSTPFPFVSLIRQSSSPGGYSLL